MGKAPGQIRNCFPQGRALVRAAPQIYASNQEKDCPAVRSRHIMQSQRAGNVGQRREGLREGV